MPKIQQWLVADSSTQRIFEKEHAALEYAVYNSQVSAPTTVRYPDGTEYAIMKKHPAWKLQVVKEL